MKRGVVGAAVLAAIWLAAVAVMLDHFAGPRFPLPEVAAAGLVFAAGLSAILGGLGGVVRAGERKAVFRQEPPTDLLGIWLIVLSGLLLFMVLGWERSAGAIAWLAAGLFAAVLLGGLLLAAAWYLKQQGANGQ